MKKLIRSDYDKIYDVLVEIGGAYGLFRQNFIEYHLRCDITSSEWRFGGKIGFGGKYRGKTNTVDCYPEDETPERIDIINKINEKLKDIINENKTN